jgi:hypothetical protein
VSYRIINTLFGEEVLNPAPKCSQEGCDKPADNAGNGRYHKLCTSHHHEKYNMKGWNYKKFRKDYCENVDGRLGFVCTSTIIEPTWQLDADHRDGDHHNNNIENIQTLCKCCHAYKTHFFGENISPSKRKKNVEIEFNKRKQNENQETNSVFQ